MKVRALITLLLVCCLGATHASAGARFVLVFEPFEEKGEPRIAAIYLQ